MLPNELRQVASEKSGLCRRRSVYAAALSRWSFRLSRLEYDRPKKGSLTKRAAERIQRFW
jgi:hypothetical protein